MTRRFAWIAVLTFCFGHFLYSANNLPEKRAFALYTTKSPRIDGKVDPVWLKATPNRGFVQHSPEQGEAATNDTRFFVLYDETNLYFLFVMEDKAVDAIPARLLDRDSEFYPDDSINLLLDTHNDHRKAYYFATNPRGVEVDGLISENGEVVDLSWDTVFKVAARKNRHGWVAEFAIPFKSLRFSDDLKYQIWGFNVWRVRKQSREISYWSLVDQNYRMYRLDKSGVLIGMKKIRGGNHLNLLPYITGKQTSIDNNSQDLKGQYGLDLQYGLTSDLTLDLTLNPDFGQVEIDEEQINLDKRFEIQLEEKRPFFLENAPVFQSPFYQMFYSRRIGALSDIKAGAKITGKTGPYNIGILSAATGDWKNKGLGEVDQYPREEYFNVLRVQRDILSSSNIGLLLADREVDPGSEQKLENRAASMDWHIYRGQKYFIGQAVFSHNARNDTTYDPASGSISRIDWNTRQGAAGYLQAGYYSRLFWLDIHANWDQPEFDINGTGFYQKIPNKGRKQSGVYFELHPLINRRWLRSWGASIQPTFVKDSDESATAWGLESRFWLEAADQSKVTIGFTRYRDVETDLYSFGGKNELQYWGRDLFLELQSDPGKDLSFRLKVSYNSQYYFQTHSVGNSGGMDVELKWRPFSNLHLQFGHKRTWLLDRENNTLPIQTAGQSHIRLWAFRGRYLITRDVFSRLFLQYTNDAEPEIPEFGIDYDAQRYYLIYDAWERISLNWLFGWRFAPRSNLYLAYTESWDKNDTRSFKSRNRVLFFKLAYLWSL